MKSKVMIIEDDKDIQELIRLSLVAGDISNITTVDDMDEATLVLENQQFEVVLLDLNLNSESGFELIKYMNLAVTKLIIVTARDSELDLYRGFEEGAVDYIRKPFDPMELAYRVKAHIRKVEIYEDRHLKLNFETAEVWSHGELLKLTNREYDLLKYFIDNSNRILSKEILYHQVWGYLYGLDDNTLMVHVRNLRKKIEVDPHSPKLIETVRGKGYIYRSKENE